MNTLIGWLVAKIATFRLSDLITARIRTWTPILVGAAVTWLAERYDIVVDSQAAAIVATALIAGLWHTLVTALERRWPIFGVLLGRRGLPSYTLPITSTTQISTAPATSGVSTAYTLVADPAAEPSIDLQALIDSAYKAGKQKKRKPRVPSLT